MIWPSFAPVGVSSPGGVRQNGIVADAHNRRMPSGKTRLNKAFTSDFNYTIIN